MIYQLKRVLIVQTLLDRETKISPIGFITQNEDETNPNCPKDTPRRPLLKSTVLSFFIYILYFRYTEKSCIRPAFQSRYFRFVLMQSMYDRHVFGLKPVVERMRTNLFPSKFHLFDRKR